MLNARVIMGGSSSKTVQDVVLDSVVDAAVSQTQETDATVDSQQIINLRHATNVIMEHVTLKGTFINNLKKIASEDISSKFMNDVALKAAATLSSKLSGAAVSIKSDQIKNSITSNTKAHFNFTNVTKLAMNLHANQIIDVESGKNIILDDVSMEVLQKNVSNAFRQDFDKMGIANKVVSELHLSSSMINKGPLSFLTDWASSVQYIAVAFIVGIIVFLLAILS